MNLRRKIAVLGSTGSIGRQTLDIISEYPEKFEAYLLVAHNSADLLTEQAIKYRPKKVIIANEAHYRKVSEALSGKGIEVLAGDDAVAAAVRDPEIDTVVTAMVGYSGLVPTINAIEAGKKIALANKETMVVAGDLVNRLLKKSESVIYPVDSEHGAFYQCLMGEERKNVSKLILTASGGPFRQTPKDKLGQVRAADALRHPNWAMGAKITIDSATMMNKGFEMLEAKWLFDVSHEDIEIVVHPQSIVHSMVEFVDGSIKAQLGLPDMHLPIRFALGLPGRLASNSRKMTIADYANLTFEKPDYEKFPLLTAARTAAERGGNAACVMNAANEIAVAAFLRDKIGFLRIAEIIEETMEKVAFVANTTLDDYVASNAEARAFAETLL